MPPSTRLGAFGESRAQPGTVRWAALPDAHLHDPPRGRALRGGGSGWVAGLSGSWALVRGCGPWLGGCEFVGAAVGAGAGDLAGGVVHPQGPAAFVHEPVVVAAQRHEPIDAGVLLLPPRHEVMGVGPLRGHVTAGRAATAIPDPQGFAHPGWGDAVLVPDIQWQPGTRVEDDPPDDPVTGQALGKGGGHFTDPAQIGPHRQLRHPRRRQRILVPAAVAGRGGRGLLRPIRGFGVTAGSLAHVSVRVSVVVVPGVVVV